MHQLRALGWAAMRRKALVAACGCVAAGVLILAGSWIVPAAATAPPAGQEQLPAEAGDAGVAEPPIEAAEPAAPSASVVVYISGAVRAPEVYQLPAAARMKDLVLAAGGLAPDADLDRINLAELLKDGSHVHIPRRGESAPDSSAGDAPAQSELIDLNSATAADLDGLPGIGQALAQRIVDYRGANGPFKSVDDLQSVKGIGAALLAKIAPLITVGP